MSGSFRMPLHPEAADIDENGHVNNIVYVRWLQEVATAHWYAAASPEDQARYFWVISRHEINYLRQSLDGETLEAETWGENPRGARFDRIIVLRGPAGDERVKARTTWVLMDRELQRPARVPKAMMLLFEKTAPTT